eukprot:COSAG01_NODE_2112_length_8403_cov_15.894027_3_plen_115_part_00
MVRLCKALWLLFVMLTPTPGQKTKSVFPLPPMRIPRAAVMLKGALLKWISSEGRVNEGRPAAMARSTPVCTAIALGVGATHGRGSSSFSAAESGASSSNSSSSSIVGVLRQPAP